MHFDPPLLPATLKRRYKRFLADVILPDGQALTVHCPNPGAMLGLNTPDSPVWISDSRNPKRKLRHTLEILEADGTLAGINTNRANALAREAIEAGLVPQARGKITIRPEQRYGENSRIDFLIEEDGKPPLYVEVKNVHLRRKPGLHEFPDSVTARGAKHLAELARQADSGNRALMLFLIQRADGDKFAIAEDIDPAYGRAFCQARNAGVKAQAIACDVTPEHIIPRHAIKILT